MTAITYALSSAINRFKNLIKIYRQKVEDIFYTLKYSNKII